MAECSTIEHALDTQWAFTTSDADDGLDPQRFVVPCRDGENLVCYRIGPGKTTPSKATLLYFHGNGENAFKLLQRSDFALPFLADVLDEAALSCGLTSILVEYRGYGPNEHLGVSLAKNLTDAEDVLTFIMNTHHVSPKDIFVMGRSMGTCSALHLANTPAGLRDPIGGLMLDASLLDPLIHLAKRSGTAEQLEQTPLGSQLAANRDGLEFFQGPVTLFHCADDEVLDVVGADRAFDALVDSRHTAQSSTRWGSAEESGGEFRRAGTLRYYRFDAGGHNYIFPMNWHLYSQGVFEMIGKQEWDSGWWARRMELRDAPPPPRSRCVLS